MLKTKITNREKIIGTHLNFSDPSVGRIMGLAGYDFVWIDMEHNYISFESLLVNVFAVKAGGTPVIVRAPQDDLTATKKILEMGVDGIIFPMIRSAEEANRILSNTLYPPYGRRGFGPMNAVGYGAYDVGEYVANDHKNLCRFIQIEHIDAVKDLEKIMENEYIDGYIFGPNDLSGSIGELGNVFGENTTALITEAIQKLKAKGKYVGLSTGDLTEDVYRYWSSLGIDMLSAGADFGILSDGLQRLKDILTQVMKQEI